MPQWLAACLFTKQGPLRSGWKILGFFLAYTVLGLALSLILRSVLHRPGLGVWLAALVAATASLLCVTLEGRAFRDLGFQPNARWAAELALGTALGIGLIAVTALVVLGLGGFHWTRTPEVGWRQVLGAAWMFLGVAFHEEMVTRGFPFQRLVEGPGVWVSQLVFAAIFALGHWGNPGMHGATKAWATLNIALAAILLGFCYLRTRSLALPIGVHLGWNWAQGSVFGFGVSGTSDIRGLWSPVFHGKPEWLTGGAFGLEASLPCALVCGAFILGLWRWKGSAASAGASTVSGS